MFEIRDSKKGVKQFIKKIISSFSNVSDIFVFYNKKNIAIRTNEQIKQFKSKDGYNKLIYNYFYNLLSNIEKEKLLKEDTLDKAYKVEDTIIRLHFYTEVSGKALAIRLKKSTVDKLSKLGFNKKDFKELLNAKSGLVIIAGPHGSGKSTTVASFLTEYASLHNAHIITIEDPIEYIFTDTKSFFSQKEIETNTSSFNKALKDALRESPDVIFISETRTKELAQELIRTSLTGKLVLSTLHSNNMIATIERIINLLDGNKTDFVNVLKVVINQRLIPTKEGLKLIYEKLDMNADIKEIVLNSRNLSQELLTYIKQSNIQTIDTKLEILFNQGLIDNKTLEGYSVY